ncbi:hypothetical protein CGRA01v4_12139 [Colletotrichum graminicola]|nr:hypothetical protein CGRA01v4_12139 [Colletotrichum graminicola]
MSRRNSLSKKLIMASCQVQGEPDLYGLGIRVAFYIQWFGAILVEYLEVAGLPDMRLLGLLFSAAALIGLVVRLSAATLQPADVYIVLLLATGVYLFLVPLYAWKVVTCFRPYWDPFRWSSETPTPAFKGLNFTLLLAVTSLAIWYWCAFAPENPCSSEQYGFLFSPISLGNKGFIASNAILYLVILLACALVLLLKIGCKVPYWRARRKKRRVRQNAHRGGQRAQDAERRGRRGDPHGRRRAHRLVERHHPRQLRLRHRPGPAASRQRRLPGSHAVPALRRRGRWIGLVRGGQQLRGVT